MNIIQLIAILATMFHGQTQPYDVHKFLEAITATGQGITTSIDGITHDRVLWWYMPEVKIKGIRGAPEGWLSGASCQTIIGGVIYLNPETEGDNGIPMNVMHELVHLANNCSLEEQDAILRSLDVMAYMGRDQDVILDLLRMMQVVQDLSTRSDLTDDQRNVLRDYYQRPLYRILRDDLVEYPYLAGMLYDLGILEQKSGGKK